MRILVTGGNGFLGQALQREFAKFPEHRVDFPTRAQCNIEVGSLLSRYLANGPYDCILHAAALCGGILANKENPAKFIAVNLAMGLNVYEAARQHRIPYIYALGSTCEYPMYCPTPFREDDLWSNYPEQTNAPYGVSKRVLLVLQNSYRESYGIKGTHLIPANLFGSHDHFDLKNSHVIPALINKFVTAQSNNSPEVHCWGTGEATREFLYVEDAAEAIVKTVLMQVDHEKPINLGTGCEISIKDLAYLIAKLVGFQGKIIFTGEVSDGQPKRRLDVSRAKELLNFEANTSLENGLDKTIAWYKENLHGK